MTRVLALCGLLAACAPPPAQLIVLPGDLPPACATEARLLRPPSPPRNMTQTTDYARAAATAAVRALRERDECAEAYGRLYQWALQRTTK